VCGYPFPNNFWLNKTAMKLNLTGSAQAPDFAIARAFGPGPNTLRAVSTLQWTPSR
jgi:hypothetical protein